MRDFFLRTDRLGFGIWTADDLSLARDLWGDARVTRWIGGPFSDQWIRERLAMEVATQASRSLQYWPIFRLADAVHVGCCGLRPVPERTDALELGFHLCAEHWGRGYASEAARAAIDLAFRTMHVAELVAGHHPENLDSRRVLERLGFHPTAPVFYPPTGLDHPSYELSAEDFTRVRDHPG